METTETNKNTSAMSEGKTIAIIAYLTIIGLIIAFVMNTEKKNAFAKYHIIQSLGLALTGLALGMIGLIPIFGWIVNLIGIFILLFMWIMGLVNAINEKETPVPLLGEHYRNWFKNL